MKIKANANGTSLGMSGKAKIDRIEAVKSYTALKVKMLFDPPQSSSTMEATKNLISELEWRLYAECDREEKQCGC